MTAGPRLTLHVGTRKTGASWLHKAMCDAASALSGIEQWQGTSQRMALRRSARGDAGEAQETQDVD